YRPYLSLLDPLSLHDALPILKDTFARKRCGRRAFAFQWNYYEKHQEAVPFRVLADVRVVRAFVWPATSFWLATRQQRERAAGPRDRKSTRLNSSHVKISYAVF